MKKKEEGNLLGAKGVCEYISVNKKIVFKWGVKFLDL